MQTHISVTLSETGVCWLSQRLCNPQERSFRGDLVYVATESFGGRSWEVQEGKEPAEVLLDVHSTFLGFVPDEVKRMWWQSATSGATLEMDGPPRKGFWNQWRVDYIGPTGLPSDQGHEESRYLRWLLEASLITDIWVIEEGSEEARLLVEAARSVRLPELETVPVA